MHRAVASKRTRQAQIWAAGMAALAGIAFFAPLGQPPAASVAAPTVTPGPAANVPPPPNPAADVSLLPEAGELGAALARLSPPVPKVESPKPAPTPEVVAAPEVPPPSPVGNTWSYIGAVLTDRDRRGIVKINEVQRLVKVDQTIDGTTVIQIEPEFIMVRDAAGERKIERPALAARPRPVAPAAVAKPADKPAAAAAVAASDKRRAMESGDPDAKLMAMYLDPSVQARAMEAAKQFQAGQIGADEYRKMIGELPRPSMVRELDEMLENGSIDQEGYFNKLQSVIGGAQSQQQAETIGGASGNKRAPGAGAGGGRGALRPGGGR